MEIARELGDVPNEKGIRERFRSRAPLLPEIIKKQDDKIKIKTRDFFYFRVVSKKAGSHYSHGNRRFKVGFLYVCTRVVWFRCLSLSWFIMVPKRCVVLLVLHYYCIFICFSFWSKKKTNKYTVVMHLKINRK